MTTATATQILRMGFEEDASIPEDVDSIPQVENAMYAHAIVLAYVGGAKR